MADLIIQNKKQHSSEASTVSQRKGGAVLQDNRSQVSQARALPDNRTAQLAENPSPKPNNTGLPNQLKSGIESLSGMSMDHVKVHYNSSQPAQLNAHAYAQGSDIHVASGQEKHLPHEAWHVVQQAQGRVKPTMQMKGSVQINDDVGLESEADVMGAKALSMTLGIHSASLTSANTTQKVAQLVGGNKAGYNPDTIVQPEFKLAVKNLFGTARELNKIRKKIAGKNNKVKLSGMAEKAKGSQVKDVYALDLSNINLDAQWLHKMVTDKPYVADLLETAKNEAIIAQDEISPITEKVKKSDEKVEIKPAEEKILDKSWVEKVGETRPEAKILTGSALFVKKTEKDAGSGVYRDIYKKLGKEDGDHNEYVLDDLGTHTRRFAYMEKSYYQWMAFKEKGFLTGKKQDLVGAATGVSALNVDPTDFEAQGMKKDEKEIFNNMPADTPENRKIALAHMHQWKGSGPGQRGLSLTSTEKDEAVYGNSGESFKSDDGAKFKIDLAKTNPADNILVNHYASNSKTRSQLLGATPGANRKLGTHYQYERSVIKNRELYLRNLTPNAVVSITPHTAGMDVARDSAIYNKSRQDAIDHGKAQRGVDEWTAYKKIKKTELDKATQDKASAEIAKNNALKEKQNAITQKNKHKGDFTQHNLRGFRYPISYFKAWESNEKNYDKQATTQIENIKKLQEIIRDLGPALDECDEQIRIFTGGLKVKPDEANLHASRGWATGEAYTKGYNEGLVAIKGKSITEDTAIKKIFDEAYEDAGKKAIDKKYKEKHSPYWEGYGAALKTAIKP